MFEADPYTLFEILFSFVIDTPCASFSMQEHTKVILVGQLRLFVASGQSIS
jgi:hypothetical protein